MYNKLLNDSKKIIFDCLKIKKKFYNKKIKFHYAKELKKKLKSDIEILFLMGKVTIIMKNIMIWDIAAALHILEGSGGKLKIIDTYEDNLIELHVSNNKIKFLIQNVIVME